MVRILALVMLISLPVSAGTICGGMIDAGLCPEPVLSNLTINPKSVDTPYPPTTFSVSLHVKNPSERCWGYVLTMVDWFVWDLDPTIPLFPINKPDLLAEDTVSLTTDDGTGGFQLGPGSGQTLSRDIIVPSEKMAKAAEDDWTSGLEIGVGAIVHYYCRCADTVACDCEDDPRGDEDPPRKTSAGVVPEPATVLLAGSGFLLMIFGRFFLDANHHRS